MTSPIDIPLAFYSCGGTDAYADPLVDAPSLHPRFFADVEDGREVVRVDGIPYGCVLTGTPGADLHHPFVGSCEGPDSDSKLSR